MQKFSFGKGNITLCNISKINLIVENSVENVDKSPF